MEQSAGAVCGYHYPTLIVFFLAQDQFVEGIAAGGVKG